MPFFDAETKNAAFQNVALLASGGWFLLFAWLPYVLLTAPAFQNWVDGEAKSAKDSSP